MLQPDKGNFTPESAIPFSDSQFVSLESGRFSRLKLFGATAAAAVFGAASGTLIGGAIALPPTYELSPERVAIIGQTAAVFGVLGGLAGAVDWLRR